MVLSQKLVLVWHQSQNCTSFRAKKKEKKTLFSHLLLNPAPYLSAEVILIPSVVFQSERYPEMPTGQVVVNSPIFNK